MTTETEETLATAKEALDELVKEKGPLAALEALFAGDVPHADVMERCALTDHVLSRDNEWASYTPHPTDAALRVKVPTFADQVDGIRDLRAFHGTEGYEEALRALSPRRRRVVRAIFDNELEFRKVANRDLFEAAGIDMGQGPEPHTSGFDRGEDIEPPVYTDESVPWWRQLLSKDMPITVVYPVQGWLLSGIDLRVGKLDPRVQLFSGDEPDMGVIKLTPFGLPMPGAIEAIKRHVFQGHRVILRDDRLLSREYRRQLMHHLHDIGVPVHAVEFVAGDSYPQNFLGTINQLARQAFGSLRRRIATRIWPV